MKRRTASAVAAMTSQRVMRSLCPCVSRNSTAAPPARKMALAVAMRLRLDTGGSGEGLRAQRDGKDEAKPNANDGASKERTDRLHSTPFHNTADHNGIEQSYRSEAVIGDCLQRSAHGRLARAARAALRCTPGLGGRRIGRRLGGPLAQRRSRAAHHQLRAEALVRLLPRLAFA